MELDRTKIAIRQRSVLETLDLSLRVTAIYFTQLLWATLPIAVPFALLNHWAFSWMVGEECTSETISRFLASMTMAVFLQAPVATLAATKFLGDMMFLQETNWRSLFRAVTKSFPAVFWTQFLWRGVGLLVLLLLTMEKSSDVSGNEALIYMMAFWMLLIRSIRPFVNEIVLLERNPVFSLGKQGVTTIGRRNRSLHGPNTGDLLSRGLANSLAIVVLVTLFGLAASFANSVVLNEWTWTPRLVTIVFPCVMWSGVLYATVLRFLCYIDLRIHREGWEVELIVRAAGQELEAVG